MARKNFLSSYRNVMPTCLKKMADMWHFSKDNLVIFSVLINHFCDKLLSGKESGPIIFTSVLIAYWYAKMLIIQRTDVHVKAE